MFEDLFYQLNIAKRLLVNKYPALSKVLKVNYGLIPELEETTDKDYIMGASDDKINWKVLNQKSDWSPEVAHMENEIQKGRLFDTMGCTGYALNNVEELIEINKWGKAINRSDRFINKMSGTSKSGNNMSYVLETRRKCGFVEEKDWAWDKEKFNWESYYSNIPQSVIDKALINNRMYRFGYDSVWATSRTMLIEALKYSPLYVGLYAWYRKGMLYYSYGRANHASVIVNRKQFTDYDSYPPYTKNLDEAFEVFYVKRLYLEKSEIDYNMNNINALIKQGYQYIINVEDSGKFYKIDENGLDYVEDIKVIADEIAKFMKETPNNVNTMLRFLTKENKVKWLSNKDYLSLLK